jgi:hypothetical protein
MVVPLRELASARRRKSFTLTLSGFQWLVYSLMSFEWSLKVLRIVGFLVISSFPGVGLGDRRAPKKRVFRPEGYPFDNVRNARSFPRLRKSSFERAYRHVLRSLVYLTWVPEEFFRRVPEEFFRRGVAGSQPLPSDLLGLFADSVFGRLFGESRLQSFWPFPGTQVNRRKNSFCRIDSRTLFRWGFLGLGTFLSKGRSHGWQAVLFSECPPQSFSIHDWHRAFPTKDSWKEADRFQSTADDAARLFETHKASGYLWYPLRSRREQTLEARLTGITSVYARVFFQARDLVHRSMRFLPDPLGSGSHENPGGLKLPYWSTEVEKFPIMGLFYSPFVPRGYGLVPPSCRLLVHAMSYRDVFFLASLASGNHLTTAVILSTLCFVRTFGFALTPLAQRRLLTLRERPLEKRRDTTSQGYRQFIPYRDSSVEPIVSLEGCLLDFVEAE